LDGERTSESPVKNVWLAVLALSAVAAAGTGGLYAYDASRSDIIAEGVTAAGVSLGGMTPEEAGSVLEQRAVPRLKRALKLRWRGSRFLVSAESLGVTVDVESTARQALAESREGNFLVRALRDLRGRPLRARVRLQVDYSQDRVAALLARVERTLERPALDARVVPSPTRLRVVRPRPGVAVRRRQLVRSIARTLVAPGAPRLVEVPTEVRKPNVTTHDLRARYPFFITISRGQKRLRLYRGLGLAKVYVIAVGQAGYDTPAGLHRIRSKAVNPAWHVPDRAWAGELAGTIVPSGSPDNPIKARWMEFHDGAGIHGTDDLASLGRAASHGCIRMSIRDVTELYEIVPMKTAIYIG
jgi:lipoprotein-anchoring transpeptidase ErfK/SrfK